MAGERRERIDCSLVGSGEGEGWWIVGDFIRIKMPGDKTGGEFCVLETTSPPQHGPPPHRHSREDESFYILDGDFEFLSNDKTVRASAGCFVHAPRGSLHTYKNVGDKPGRFLVFVRPAGFENFFREIGRKGDDSTAPPDVTPEDIQKLLAAAPKYGLEIVLPGADDKVRR